MSDLISRQDAIEAIRKFQTYKLFKKDNMLLVDKAEVMTELMMLPSADRPTGEWIEVTNGRGGHECSECHSYAPSYASGDEYIGLLPKLRSENVQRW